MCYVRFVFVFMLVTLYVFYNEQIFKFKMNHFLKPKQISLVLIFDFVFFITVQKGVEKSDASSNADTNAGSWCTSKLFGVHFIIQEIHFISLDYFSSEFSHDRNEMAKVFSAASNIFHAFGAIDEKSMKKILKRYD